jgi:hypothetical protein
MYEMNEIYVNELLKPKKKQVFEIQSDARKSSRIEILIAKKRGPLKRCQQI